MSRKNSSILLVILMLMICPHLIAQSHFTISKEFKVISVNGKAHTQNLLSKDSLLKLNSGLNKIAIAYQSDFKNSSGDRLDHTARDLF